MKVYIVIFILILSGCREQPYSYTKQMIFNWYNGNDSLIKTDAYKLDIYTNKGFDSIIAITGETVYFTLKQTFDSSGIYRSCNNEMIKTHSLKDSLKTEYCKNYPPFINSNVSYRGKKVYLINDKQYSVYHFIESFSNHTSYDSYFVNEGIPFCYYSFDSDSYIFCDTIKGYDLSKGDIGQLKIKLLSDTSFFARYFLQKNYPNYHRPKALYNQF